jgi:Protein of unknown function (DUF1207)
MQSLFGGIMMLRWFFSGFALLSLTALASAQSSLSYRPITAPAPAPEPSTGPGSHGWPASQTPPVYAPLPVLEAPPSGFAAMPQQGYAVLDAEGLPPLPGSLEDNFNNEVNARRAFRICTWNDYRISIFPNSLLWENGFADKRAPRLSLTGTNFKNPVTDNTLENSIGTTFAGFRIDTPGRDLAFQLDIFAVVHSRLSPEDLLATDYRFGVPLSFQYGNWRGKIAYEHTSTHLGDEYQRNSGNFPKNYAKDEVVIGLARDIDTLRIYGQVSYAFFQDLVGDPKRWRYDAGFQYVLPWSGGLSGAPYIAAHAVARGDVQYNPDVNAQIGWLWRNPYQRLANLRVFVEYNEGRSQFGQFAFDREKFYGIGIAADF